MTPGKKIYFASDFHLGIPNKKVSFEREKLIIQWLDEIKNDAAEIFLVGDIFDFWFEYKNVVPKGYVRLFGKLAQIRDSGIPIYVLSGNHDMWMFGYFEDELDIPVFHKPIEREFAGKKFFIGHGDGLGPGDQGYKFIKKVFRNKVSQWLFSWLHPDIGIAIANYWSKKSRFANGGEADPYLGDNQEWLALYCKNILKEKHFDYFVFGHRHLVLDVPISDKSRYLNLGDWLSYNSYAVFDGKNMELKYYKR